MSDRNQSQARSLWNKSTLTAMAFIGIFLLLPVIFTLSSRPPSEFQVVEEVGLEKKATDLLSTEIWWPLLLVSIFFFGLAIFLSRRRLFSKNNEEPQSDIQNLPKHFLILGGLTIITYCTFFLLPFPLLRFYNLKRVSMGWIADRNWVAALTLAFAFVTLFLLYLAAYRLLHAQNSDRMWAFVFLGALIFGLINFFVFPLSSTDLYDYVSRGRISGIHNGNPLVELPDDYPDDPYVQLAAWRKDPSAYGPLWEVVGGLIGRFSGRTLWSDLLGYKSIALISYLLSTAAIASILRRVGPHQSLAGTLLFAWNPLVLIEGVANAHNDMLMIALVMGCFWLLSRRKRITPSEHGPIHDSSNLLDDILALLFLAFAVLVKFIPILLLPPILLYMYSKEERPKRGIRTILFYLLPIVLVFILYYWVFWDWPDITNSLIQRTGMFRMSLASAMKLLLVKFLQEGWAEGIAAWVFLGAFGVSYLIVLSRMASKLGFIAKWDNRTSSQARLGLGRFLRRIFLEDKNASDGNPWEILVATSFYILLLYLLLGSLWFWPWYLIWPLALLALHQNQPMVATLIVVGCAGQLSYILWNFVWYWMGIEWDTLYVIEMLILILLLLPALAIVQIYKQRGNTETI